MDTPKKAGWSRLTGIVATAVMAALVAGCGEPSGLSTSDLQQHVWKYAKGQVGNKVSVDDPRCVKDSTGHWRCLVVLRYPAGKVENVEVSATCDADRCLYQQTG